MLKLKNANEMSSFEFYISLKRNTTICSKTRYFVCFWNQNNNRYCMVLYGGIRSHLEKMWGITKPRLLGSELEHNTKNVDQVILLDGAVLRLSDWHRLRERWHTREVAVTRAPPTEWSTDIIGLSRIYLYHHKCWTILRQILRNMFQKKTLGII